jgi:hypothetical protein
VTPKNDAAVGAGRAHGRTGAHASTVTTPASIVCFASAAVLLGIVCGAGEPPLESGPRVGEIADMFSVRAVTGPYRGKTLCYRCELGNSPVVCIFARQLTAPLTALFKELDAHIASGNDGLKALVVFLADDAKEAETKLEGLAARSALRHVPLTLARNRHGPQNYRIAAGAEVTILLWKGPTVRINRAFGHGKMTEADVKDILLDLPRLLKD